ncbi:MAG: hypothetical protein HC936_01505 [Leptolyngbyaceae cyanobacterium SU_3_3]|nr:hypothetical protein [Leptolyngbyaceae cyanobacterium SU_3_3]
MPETFAIGIFVASIIFILIGVLGGEFKIFGAEISKTISNPILRTISGFFGGFLFLVSVSVFFSESAGDFTNTFSATSHCSARDVYGYGESSNVESAQKEAIGDCIRNGGVPDCCARDVSVSQE